MAIAAIDLGRPVKWIEDRSENFVAAYQGRGIAGDLELALADDGRMVAIRAHLRADLGAYLLPSTVIPPHTAAMLITGCYDIPAAEVTIFGARTHKVPTGPYRGAGRPDAAYMLERIGRRRGAGSANGLPRAAAAEPDRTASLTGRRSATSTTPATTSAASTSRSSWDSDGLDPADEGWIRGEGAAVFVERGGGRSGERRDRRPVRRPGSRP